MSRNARKKMSPESGDEPPMEKSRFLGKKSQVVEDEKVDGEYGLVINGHSLVRQPSYLDLLIEMTIHSLSCSSSSLTSHS